MTTLIASPPALHCGPVRLSAQPGGQGGVRLSRLRTIDSPSQSFQNYLHNNLSERTITLSEPIAVWSSDMARSKNPPSANAHAPV